MQATEACRDLPSTLFLHTLCKNLASLGVRQNVLKNASLLGTIRLQVRRRGLSVNFGGG